MELEQAMHLLENYNLWLTFLGLAVLATSALPRLLAEQPLSMPMVLLVLGYSAVALPLGLEAPDPMKDGVITEHLTEIGVIIALMGAGLKLDRKPGLKSWSATWRLLGITMVLTIGLSAVIGWSVASFAPAAAVLLGAVIAPTDPVLASEVQVGAPGQGLEDEEDEAEAKDTTKPGPEDEVRFALTSEAGLNDGLAFPFTNVAVAMAMVGANPTHWIETWLLVDVLYKLGVGGLIGVGLGYLLARILLSMPSKTPLAKSMVGLGALAATLIIYGVTEFAGGYGFLATFIGAAMIRNYKRRHEYHEALDKTTEKLERLLSATILIAFGGAIAGGLLEPLNGPLVISAILIVLVVRPVAGVLGFLGFSYAPWRERLAISFFGIRGIGSMYYLAYALNQESFPEAKELWALVGLVIVISVFIHGMTAAPVTAKLDEMRREAAGEG